MVFICQHSLHIFYKMNLDENGYDWNVDGEKMDGMAGITESFAKNP